VQGSLSADPSCGGIPWGKAAGGGGEVTPKLSVHLPPVFSRKDTGRGHTAGCNLLSRATMPHLRAHSVLGRPRGSQVWEGLTEVAVAGMAASGVCSSQGECGKVLPTYACLPMTGSFT
jgi:hypothetical protein